MGIIMVLEELCLYNQELLGLNLIAKRELRGQVLELKGNLLRATQAQRQGPNSSVLAPSPFFFLLYLIASLQDSNFSLF